MTRGGSGLGQEHVCAFLLCSKPHYFMSHLRRRNSRCLYACTLLLIWCNVQLIGLREMLQENPIFHGKIYGFCPLKCNVTQGVAICNLPWSHVISLHAGRGEENKQTTMWSPQTIAKFVHITPITMVYGAYNELVSMVYKPTNIPGGAQPGSYKVTKQLSTILPSRS